MKTTLVDSPLGPLRLRSDGESLTGLYLPDHRRMPDVTTDIDADLPIFQRVREQLDQYFAGERRAFDLALAPVGTPFQHRVWALLREIPYGETRSYGQLAALLGTPKASRAVGSANARNPISIIVPCHRVVGATGNLTGYAGGAAAKDRLLALERGIEATLRAN